MANDHWKRQAAIPRELSVLNVSSTGPYAVKNAVHLVA